MALSKGNALYLSLLRPLALPRVSKFHRSFLVSPRNSSTSTTSASTASSAPVSIRIPASPPAEGVLAPARPTSKPSVRAFPYRVNRTPSLNLPVYHDTKRGGNLKQTKLQKLEGDINTLRTELRDGLQLNDKEIVINQLTKHIIIRGWRKPDVVKFLEERGF